MKKILFLMLMTPLISFVCGQSQTTQELRLVEKIYYDRGVYISSDEDRERLKELVFEMRADSTVKIHIIGYSDQWGSEEVNRRFSHVRAMYIADWMRSCRVPREQIAFIGDGVDSLATDDAEARRVEVLRVVEVEVAQTEPAPAVTETEPAPAVTETEPAPAVTETEPAPAVTETEPAPAVTETEPAPAEPEATSQQDSETLSKTQQDSAATKSCFEWNYFTPRTNLLYWLGGVMNIGVEYKNPESDFGFVVNGGYSPFGSTNWSHNLGGWFVSPEVRYYLSNQEQWFVGAQLLAAGYNFKLSDTGKQGTLIGGGVMGGYKLTLSDTFDMDFTLGLGVAHLKYDTYTHDDATNTNPYIEKGITKNSFIPIQAGVNLIWKIK